MKTLIGILFGVGFGALAMYFYLNTNATETAVLSPAETQQSVVPSFNQADSDSNEDDVIKTNGVVDKEIYLKKIKELESLLEAKDKDLKNSSSMPKYFDIDKLNFSDGDGVLALEKIKTELLTADEEYVEFMQKKIDSDIFSDMERVDTKNLTDLYTQEIDYEWAAKAESFIQNFFAGSDAYELVLNRVHCRKESCEVFGHYFSEEKLNSPTIPARKIFVVFSKMQQSEGYAELFDLGGTMTMGISEDRSNMNFYSFIHSAKR